MDEPNSNPMLNSVILGNIFGMLPISDLASCRQVCKTWFEESKTRWRRDMWLKLGESEGGRSNDTTLALSKFLDLDENAATPNPPNLEGVTFKKFKLQHWDFHSEKDDKWKAQFWKTYGPVITHLAIEQSVFGSREDFEAVIFQSIPNLQSLTLNRNKFKVKESQIKMIQSFSDVVSNANKMESVKKLQLNFDDSDSNAKLPLTFLEFIGNYPNLKSLELSGFPNNTHDVHTFEGLLEAMLSLSFNGGYKWAIEHLDIFHLHRIWYPRFDQGPINFLLKSLQLPLTSLTLDIGSDTYPSDFKIMLETYANSLRKLVVFRKDGRSLIPDVSHRDFPFGVQLESLAELRLLGTAVTPNLKFMRFMPNLRSVFLAQETGSSMMDMEPFLSDSHLFSDLRKRQMEHEWGYLCSVFPVGNTNFSQMENTVFPKIEEFILCGKNDTVCSAEQVAALARIMPNLKKVRVGLDNDGFRIVCSAWKEMELLIIHPCEVNACGITGTLPGLQTQLPNLNDLTRLRYFAYACKAYRNSKVLAMDDSIVGVDTYKNLIKDTTAPPRAQITDEALQEFIQNVPHCKIKRFDDGDEEWPDLQEHFDEDDSSNGNRCPSDFEEDMVNILKFNNEIIEQQRRENGGDEDGDEEWEDVEDDDESEDVEDDDEMGLDVASDADEADHVKVGNREG
ncbi:unnamed protein product [Orchesella dallaii]|uniref:F-box domain-containing protein n=1 Tax=Orchesella dallaii TaxID=48710 RepID=A0ABP1SB51_9HEXA